MQHSQHSHDEKTILAQAADWLLLMDEQPLTQEQQQAFEQWQNTSPQHQKIWRRAEKVQQKLYGHTQHISSNAAKNILIQQAEHSSWVGKWILLFAGSAVLSFSIYMAEQQAWLADYRTNYAEQQTITLEDGTKISLNSKTAIDINYNSHQRQIKLRFGEIYVETAKDPAQRPFTVLNQDGEMLALGTAFNVRQQSESTALMVTEHAVKVTTQHSQQQQLIQAGQQISFSPQQLYPIQPLQYEQMTWRKGLMTVNRVSLAEFAQMIEQHYGITVDVNHLNSEQTLLAIEVSGSYPINNLDRMIVLLENTYPITIEKGFLGNSLKISARN